jgi:regulation of enolase protein 1 (concanavalin A-like superfamily)
MTAKEAALLTKESIESTKDLNHCFDQITYAASKKLESVVILIKDLDDWSCAMFHLEALGFACNLTLSHDAIFVSWEFEFKKACE